MKHMVEKAKGFKKKIGNLAKCADDATALECIEFFELWNHEAKYKKGDRIVYAGKLYKVIKNHWASADATPDATPTMYNEVVAVNVSEPV